MAKKQTTSAGRQSQKTPKKSSSKTKSAIKMESALQQNTIENAVFSQNSDIYTDFANGISALLEEARHLSAKSVNAILTATYWEMGRRIVEIEQNGRIRAEYGEKLLIKLSQDLMAKFGRGFGVDNLERMRLFYNAYPQIAQAMVDKKIVKVQLQEDASLKQKSATLLRKLVSASLAEYLTSLAQAFPLSWSHYIRLLSVKTPEARKFYETEAIRGGWPVRQLDRQISTSNNRGQPLAENLVPALRESRENLVPALRESRENLVPALRE